MEKLLLKSLLQKIAEHSDPAAFKQLYQYFFQQLKSFSYAITQSHEQSEDVVEEVFIQLWMQKEKLSSIKNLNVHLYKRVGNISTNYLKNETDRSIIKTSICKAPKAIQGTLGTGTGLRRPADRAIQMLPTRSKLIFKMAKEDKLNCREIAAVLDTNLETIEGQLADALKTIGHAIHLGKSNRP